MTTILNRMRREDHVRGLAWASSMRTSVTRLKAIGSTEAPAFVGLAHKALDTARRDRGYAALAGWKLP